MKNGIPINWQLSRQGVSPLILTHLTTPTDFWKRRYHLIKIETKISLKRRGICEFEFECCNLVFVCVCNVFVVVSVFVIVFVSVFLFVFFFVFVFVFAFKFLF